MAKVNTFLSQRFKQATDKLSKMTGLAELSSTGGLSSFAGVFKVCPLTQKEQDEIAAILSEYAEEHQDTGRDLSLLLSITSEVKAINNQAAILHGERIKKAQEVLKQYRDGAFSAWLVATYGNRQTPYNFLQYFELYNALPALLHPKLDEMPRQAVYTLASRNGSLEQKQEIIQNYQGEPKQQLLSLIRDRFPLAKEDKRASNVGAQAIQTLLHLRTLLHARRRSLEETQKAELRTLLASLQDLIH